MAAPDPLPGLRSGVEAASFATEVILFDPLARLAHELGGIDAIVADACSTGEARGELEQDIAAHFPADDARQVVDAALDRLARLGVLEGTEPAVGPPCLGCVETLPPAAPLRRRPEPHLATVGALATVIDLRGNGTVGRALAELLGDLVLPDPTPATTTMRISTRRSGTAVAWGRQPHTPRLDDATAVAAALMSIDAVVAEDAAPRWTVLHAATVARSDRAVAITGHSGDGKTTLAAAAVLAGWAYVADEVTAVDQQGRALPYHRPLGLRPDSAALLGLAGATPGPGAVLRPWRVGPDRQRSGPTPLVAMVRVRWRPGPVQLARLDAPRAVLTLADCSSLVEPRPGALGALVSVSEHLPVYELVYGSTDDGLTALSNVTKGDILTRRV